MTWIDWATVACAVYAALLSTLVAIRQQLLVRSLRRQNQRLRPELARLKSDLAAHRLGTAVFGVDLPIPS